MDGSPRTPALGLAALLCLSAPAAADLVVDPSGAGDHTTIQAAVDAAAPDELILVKAGTYAGSVVVDGKPLWIAAVGDGDVLIVGSLQVQNLAADEVFVAIGIDASPPAWSNLFVPAPAGLALASNQGEVRIHDGVFVGANGLCDTSDEGDCSNAGAAGAPGLRVAACARVALATSTFRGGVGGEPGNFTGAAASGAGAHETQSAVAAWGCTFRGGNGRSTYGPGGDGGHGFHAQTFGVFASRCHLEGGRGGNDLDFIVPRGGDGGDGLVVGAASQARLTSDTVTLGGARGVAVCVLCGGFDGVPGEPTSGSGPVIAVSGPGRTLQGQSVVAGGGTPIWTARGAAGDTFYYRYAAGSRFLFKPWRRGFDLVDTFYFSATPLGVLPELGPVHAGYALPGTSGLPSLRLFGQAFVVQADGEVVLGGPHDVVLLDCTSGPVCLATPDCDGDGTSDADEVGMGAPDCNANGVPDACDIASTASYDCNGNGLPDECERGGDCNANGVPDTCDIAGGTSADSNSNGVPDECESVRTWYVDAAATPGGDGSRASPFQALAQAFAAAIDGSVIAVADGLYAGPANRNLNTQNRDLVIRGVNGAAGCIIDCQDAARAFTISGGSVRLEGLTIRNGRAVHGGGVAASGTAQLEVVSCSFEDCSTMNIAGGGAGIYATNERLTVTGTSFLRCTTQPGSFGGGIVSYDAQTTVDACTFVDCSARHGGGILGGQSLSITRSVFLGNAATQAGGAIASGIDAAQPGEVLRVEGCLIAGNTAQIGGGIGLYAGGPGSGAPFELVGTTLVGNAASVDGGGLWSDASLAIGAYDCVVWGNSASGQGDQIAVQTSAQLTLDFSAVQGGLAAIAVLGGAPAPTYGAGNLSLDPLFVDADGADDDPLTPIDNDYRLGSGSPCVDAADNARVGADVLDVDGDFDVLEPVPFDLDGNPRFTDDPAIVDTGVGTPPIVDMGAYERQP